ncbi:UDP-N-acetylmuramate--L-alanine ligase [Cryobacterium sp. TMT1-21]|uniref:UDP-N-acetylmuramate--L-alanine ligase n=1 Tax=Cryobacterium shii TaxID=1259235 RepID=A0AAQ2HGY3_9MICO|nr:MULTISPECIES: UDP-N-acetylmuramate--L-alanine ligase [Cryobacterium]TFC52048.1 UDP-N-acetylmuramate--L-alanine ligase [Cryobacterium shii]TFC85469.1 UDP-N-acetylmuramate--L-alanine ligase [Cryobacterium sp. TmT2-59]TFD06950.1 UDP-N-acetylmuramate--L-alanine ligase [Cryobacterium sp. TMT1-21]TFD16843.1 UDP-N-acetylmuramate--L-alanine ligase [Cryobacterium sp. TMT2-23]TFD19943.1 UDP-N-acetylmuramate--L-alanine ligase [Cryobacterium sp. TMT4-10]
MIKPDLNLTIPRDLGTVHFVGIGGSGMSGIARLFIDAGHTVTGSDVRESDNVLALRKLGARIAIGHAAENVGDADSLVVTGALWQDNPEYVLAREKGLPVLHRSQALAWLIEKHRLVAVAGAHGKTTSTGMIVTGLLGLGQHPSFVNGGVIESLGVSAASGTDDLFVVEADESDGSFLLYNTAVALVTNVDPDHLDHYGSLEAFEAAFVEFAQNATELVVISSDDPGAVSVTGKLAEKRVITFGEDDGADVRLHSVVTDGPVRFGVAWAGHDYFATLRIPGRHNAINAAGAFAVLVGLGFEAEASLAAISEFGGTERRFELHGTVGGVSVYDDYAHHPTEVAAALSAARTVVGSGRIIAVHQPHLYSRTRLFAQEFADALETCADQTVVLGVYGAREDPEPGVTGTLVADRFLDPSHVVYVPDWQEAADYVASIARDGDFVVTLGCGDVYRIVPQLLGSLTRARG